jgi:hypothetical protein
MEAVKTWPEPLIKDTVGYQSPIQMRQEVAEAADGHTDGGDESGWVDEP